MDMKNIKIFNDIDDTFEERMLDILHPVGSLFWTSKSPNNGGNPNELFVGTWERVEDVYIHAAADSDVVDNTPKGSTTVKLSSSNLPKHTHGMNGHGHTLSVTIDATGDGGFGVTFWKNTYYDNFNYGTWGFVTKTSVKASTYNSSFTITSTGAKLSVDFSHAHSHDIACGAPTNSNTSDGGFDNDPFTINPIHINRYCWQRVS